MQAFLLLLLLFSAVAVFCCCCCCFLLLLLDLLHHYCAQDRRECFRFCYYGCIQTWFRFRFMPLLLDSCMWCPFVSGLILRGRLFAAFELLNHTCERV